MRLFILSILLFTLCAAGQTVEAQIRLEGTISDAEAGIPLEAANILVEGTYSGTITNLEGVWAMNVRRLPVTLLVRYIGYKSQRVTINRYSGPVHIKLNPIVYEYEELVFTGEDPAYNIMRKVIARKIEMRERLNTWEATAYTRFSLANDDEIASITEAVSEVYWDKEEGFREVIKSRRQTESNGDFDFGDMGFAGQTPNLYDDDIEVAEFNMPGPTSPEALDFYEFELLGYRKLDDQTVYDIGIKARNKLQPCFEGTISILQDVWAMIEVDLTPNDVIRFPTPIQEFNLRFKQQFSDFGQEVYLPVDFRLSGTVKVGMIGLSFPPFVFEQVSRLTDYNVNITVPDTLFKSDRVTIVDSVSVEADSLFEQAAVVAVPLSEVETLAYQTLDSTSSFLDTFKPTGALARFVIVEIEGDDVTDDDKEEGPISKFISYFAPWVGYNRVDEGKLGLSISERFIDRDLKIEAKAAYLTGPKDWSYAGGINYRWGYRNRWRIGANYFNQTQSRYKSTLYSNVFGEIVTSFASLMGQDDYFDFYHAEGYSAGVSKYFAEIDSRVGLYWTSEKQTSLSQTTSYDIVGRKRLQRDNPAIADGQSNSISLSVRFKDHTFSDASLGASGLRGATLNAEISDGKIGSDFDFARYQLVLDWRIPTFLKRRILPNVFDIRLVAGTSTGNLPIQKMMIVDGALSYFAPFGSFKTVGPLPFEGQHYAAFFWEHNFRTVPFEIINFDWAVDKNIGILIHGASGRTWIDEDRLDNLGYSPSYQNTFRHEAGVSLNGLFSLGRLDYTKRLDSAGWAVTFTVARLF